MRLKEIAIATNTSIATVSRVINNKDGVSIKKRKEIEKFLLNIGVPLKSIDALEETNKKIAIIIPDIQNPFFSKITKNISSHIRELNYQVSIYDTDENYSIEKKVIDSIISDGISGVIICISDGELSSNSINSLEEEGIPTVMIDRELEFYHDGVFFNDFKAGFIATEALINEGHKKIGIITGNLDLKHAYNRYAGYLHALKKYKIEKRDELILQGDHKMSGGYKQAQFIHNNNLDIEAIITCNNLTLLGYLKFIKQNDISKKISIISFDNPHFLISLILILHLSIEKILIWKF